MIEKIMYRTLFIILISSTVINAVYHGCFKETSRRRTYNRNPGAIEQGTLTPELCQTLCGGLGYSYGVLAAGIFCWCGDTSPSVLTQDVGDTKCSTPCEGDPAQNCGSLTHVRIFDALSPITLSVTVSQQIVPTSSAVTFTPNVVTNNPGYRLSLDYDDEAGATAFEISGSGLLSRTFFKASKYNVVTKATNTDQTLPAVETATGVLVQTRPSSLTLSCPTDMATYEPSFCTATVPQGTDMEFQIDYTDGAAGPAISRTFSIPDAIEYSMGNNIMSHQPTPQMSSTSISGLMLLYQPAQNAGKLVAFEYFAAFTGSLGVYVYRPNCGGDVYCYDTNLCTVGSCSPSCGGDFCMDTIYCCSGLPVKSNALLASYDQVYTYTHTVAATGHGGFSISDDVDILPGDIIGYESAGTRVLSYIGNADPRDFYCNLQIGGPASVTAVSCSTTFEQTQLKAIYSSPAKVLLPFDFTLPGAVTVNTQVRNKESSIAVPVSTSSVINVLEGVDKCVFSIPYYIKANVLFDFTLETFTGTSVSVDWNFGNGDTLTVGSALTIASYMYTTTGTFTISTNISNSLSFKANTTTVCVEEEIVGLNLGVTAGVEVGVVTPIQLQMTSGSDYSCSLTVMYSSGFTDVTTFTSTDIPPNGNINHVFSEAGSTGLSIVCLNNINTQYASKVVTSVERITGLRLDPPGAENGVDYYIVLRWDAGSDVQLTVIFDGAVEVMTIDSEGNVAISELKFATSLSTHTVVVEASNALSTETLSTNFIIESPMINPVISCTFPNEISAPTAGDKKVIPINTGVDCTFSMDEGTSVSITIDWGDGSPNYNYNTGVGNPWQTNEPTMPITHTYTAAVEVTLVATMSNNMETITQPYTVVPMINVDNVVLQPALPELYLPPADVNFSWIVTGPMPNNVFARIEWGEDNYDEFEDLDLNQDLQHVYRDRAGSLTLTWHIWNYASSKNDSFTVDIVSKIENTSCTSSVTAGIPGTPVDIVYKAQRAPGAGLPTLDFTCGNGAPVLSRLRTGNSPDGEDIEQCTYAATGTYTVSVVTSSLLETDTCTHNMVIMNPVTSDYTILSNAPLDFEATPCDLTVQVDFTGAPLPDSAFFDFDYGDGIVETGIPFGPSVTRAHSYATHGGYSTDIRVYNDASEFKVTIESGCYADITTTTMTVLREPFLPIGGPDLVGFGTLNDIFRTDEPLKIYPIISGTFGWYEASAVSATHIYSCNSTDQTVVALNVPEPGNYVISLQAKNRLYSGPVITSNINVIRPSTGISISDFGIRTSAHMAKTFNISMGSYGNGMCVAIHNGQDSTVYLYGDATTCSVTSVSWWPTLPVQYDPALDVSQAFIVQYTYTTENDFELVVHTWNDYSHAEGMLSFSVSATDCSAPILDIEQRRPNFRDPMRYYRARRAKIVGTTSMACPKTLANTKQWFIESYDGVNDVALGSIDTVALESEKNAELSINPHFLPYGLYKLTYEVKMNTATATTGANFKSRTYTFIEIVESELVVQLFENAMSTKTVGPNVVLTLNPKANSYDPDINTAAGEVDNFDSFMASCIDTTNGEERQLDNVTVTPMNLTDVPAGPNLGGCFHSGPGWFYLPTGSLTIQTDILTPNHKYEIHVIGTKSPRVGEFTAFLEVMSADPPDSSINFKQPEITISSSKGRLVSPNNQLGLEVATPCADCTYMWTLYVYDYEYLAAPYYGWRLLPYLFRYIEGTESEELTVHTEVFSHYYERNDFQVRLEVTNTVTTITGKSTMNLVRNKPPHSGNCTIDPVEGTAMMTNHTVECFGFIDDDNQIEDYTVKCKGAENYTIIASGSSSGSWLNRYLPHGNSSDGDTVQCYVEVSDDLGAIGVYFIGSYVSHPASLTDLKSTLEVWANNDNSYIAIVEAKATLEETTAVLSALSPALAELSKDDENNVYNGMGSALSFLSTGLDDEPRPNSFAQPDPDPDAIKQFEEDRDTSGKVVKKLLSTMKIATMWSNHETDLTFTALSDISQNKALLQREAQNSMVDLLNQGIRNLKRNMATLSVESAQKMTGNVMDICTNLQESIVLNADYPSNDDMRNEESSVPRFPTNLYSEVPDVKEFMTDAEAKESGKRILNKVSQTSFTSSASRQCNDMKENMVDILINIKPKSNEPFSYTSGRVEMTFLKTTASNLVNREVKGRAGSFSIPADTLDDEDPEEPLTLISSGSSSPGVVLDDTLDSPADKRSRCLELSFKRSNGQEKKVQNLKTPIPMEIKRDGNRVPYNDSELVFMNPEILDSRPDDIGFVQSITVTKANSAMLLQFLDVTNITRDNQLLLLINYLEKPELTADGSKVKHVCMIPKHTKDAGKHCTSNEETDPYTCFLDADIIGNKTGEWKVLIRQLQKNELNLYSTLSRLPNKPRDNWKTNRVFYQNYKFKTVEIACSYMEKGSTVMKTDGCKPVEICDDSSIKCECNHLTSFAGGWVVAPNTIDWDFIFSNADFMKNPTLYITQIIIIVAFILAFIWARRRDKQDLTKLGLAPLLDNEPRDKYYYEIMVNTGMRRNAGTESKVHFILSGEEDETDVRTFTDKKRKIFQRGNTDGFLMAVESSLGSLSYLRIWHDNSGKGKSASWYLNHIVIRDVQTDKKYYFIANKWFAVEEEDGQVDRVIPVAGKEQMTEFSYMFSERATKNLSDGHLWFSVVARPPQSRFTRCQRVSCCLCLLYMSMLANAMFYGTAENNSNAFQFGPFALTPEQIFIGVASNILIFPVNFLIITLFCKARPRKLRPSRVEEALKSMPERTTSMTDVNMRVKSSMSNERPGSSFLIDAKQSDPRPDSSLSAETPLTKNKKKKKCTLPWWFVIVSWILLWVAVLVSLAFVTAYGIQFQDMKCKKWITSMLISFFTSVFLTQPIKVFLFAIIFSLIIKNPGGDEEESDEDEEPTPKLNNDEELLHDEDDGYGLVAPRRAAYKPKPPNAKTLEVARKQRLKEIQMWSIIREILFYAFFLWILLVISYKSVSNDSYNYKHNMEKVFILTNGNNTFTGIKNLGDYWKWARQGMLRGLRAGPYYNNFPPFYMRGYIDDKVSRLMGYAVLRQLRVEPSSCKIPYQVENIIDECNAPYSINDEQRNNFGPGWTPTVNASRPEYIYTDSDTLNGYPYWGEMAMYSGGGYVVHLNKDYQDMVDQFHVLEDEKWIDEYTRAVFLEFTVYNPSINMFAISTLLAEFRPSGGVFPSYRFEPATLLPYMNSALLFQVICEIVYFLFTLYFIFKECRAFYKQKLEYFKQFWNIIELFICAMSVTAIVIYFYRLVCINELTEYFKETNGNEYMKFQYVGYWSEIFSYIIGFLVYFACLKFLKLLRFNKKVSLLTDTLRNSAKDLIHFSIIFNIVFLAFIQVFYLIYVARISTFRTFLTSCEAGIVMMMGKFDIYNMLEVNQWLTQVFLFLFVVTITFIIVNMFLSILNDTFGAVRNNMSKQSNDYEIVDFMMNRFKLWTGIGRGSNTTISPTDMENQRRNNYNTLEGQIDYFPDQIDRFLASISNMYMQKSKFDDFLHSGAYGKMAKKAQMHGGSGMHPAPKPGSTRLSSGMKGMTNVHTD